MVDQIAYAQKYRKKHQGKHLVERIDIGGNNEECANALAVTTTGSGTTTALQIAVPTTSAVGIEVTAVAADATPTKVFFGRSYADFMRAAGNVSQVSSTVVSFHQGSATGISFSANTTDQTVDVLVGGEAATTMYWKVTAKIRRVVAGITTEDK